MSGKIATLVAASAGLASAGVINVTPRADAVGVTPHEQYSSSIGVPGCKINTNRVAYWPGTPGCDDICVKLTYEGNTLNVLKIDSSAGAYDISFDAWNQLVYGKPATVEPHAGGAMQMTYETVPVDQCADLLDGGRVPLLAANSINYLSGCLNQPDSYVAKNYKLLNILDPICKYGIDEECTLDLAVSNQPSCPSGLGSNAPLNLPVTNIAYPSGEEVPAA